MTVFEHLQAAETQASIAKLAAKDYAENPEHAMQCSYGELRILNVLEHLAEAVQESAKAGMVVYGG